MFSNILTKGIAILIDLLDLVQEMRRGKGRDRPWCAVCSVQCAPFGAAHAPRAGRGHLRL